MLSSIGVSTNSDVPAPGVPQETYRIATSCYDGASGISRISANRVLFLLWVSGIISLCG